MTKAEILRVIRKNCIDCMGGQSGEVLRCTCGPDSESPCEMFLFRMGKDPFPNKKKSEAAKKRFSKFNQGERI